MKTRLIISALCFALVTGLTAHAAPTPLEKQMKIMGKSFKQLKAQASDASKNASSAALVKQMEDAAAAAEKLTPEKTSDLPADKQAAFVADYQASMKKLEATLAKLSAAFSANDNAAAKTLMADVVSEMKAGHREFKKPQQ